MSNLHSKKTKYRVLSRMVRKYLSGKATPPEQEFLETYYAYFDREEDGLANMSSTEQQELRQQMEDRIFSNINKRKYNYRWLQIAAVLLLCLGIGVILRLNRPTTVPAAKVAKTSIFHNDINPGGNAAILTLADGQTVSLNDIGIGKAVKQGNAQARKLRDGQLVYQIRGKNLKGQLLTGYNTIQTPVGGTYQVVLPDGTGVWLNSGSSLRFPVVFSGSTRDVELTGEGYFEVAKDVHKPFTVKVNETQITVHGTHFNIMAYKDEPYMRTTLLEGAVAVRKGNEEKLLKPGEQAKIGSDNRIQVGAGDADAAVAWKNGYFHFDHDDIETVMRQLARWYDMDVSFEGTPSKDELSGKIRRNVKASKALQYLEMTNLHFRISGKKVTVIQ